MQCECPIATPVLSQDNKCSACSLPNYWDPNYKQCRSCAPGLHYNSTIGQCYACPPGYQFNTTSYICFANILTCPGNQLLNQQTQICECPASTPYFTGTICVACDKPHFWNETMKACLSCGSNSYLNVTLGRCVSCPVGYQLSL